MRGRSSLAKHSFHLVDDAHNVPKKSRDFGIELKNIEQSTVSIDSYVRLANCAAS